MRKEYELAGQFEGTGENTVQPLVLWGRDGRPLYEPFSKTASVASDYLHQVQPQPGKTIVLVLAMGAYETYDLNRNGDGFNEFPFKEGVKPLCGHPGCDPGIQGWVTQSQTLPQHYSTFENAKNFMHHQNKDVAKSVGDVLKAFWNPYMHRVELLVGIDNNKAPDIVQRISDHEFPAVSMGCRIKYDVCTICGHRAPTRKEYCDHLRFGMRQPTRGGLRAGALNPSPNFFDISWVVRPADQTGYMMKKVALAYEIRTAAEAGEYQEAVAEKRAAIRKIADMDKIVRGLPVDYNKSPLSAPEGAAITSFRDQEMPHILKNMPAIDDKTLYELSKHPLSEVLSTMHAAGVVLSTKEFVKLLMARMSPGVKVPEAALQNIVDLQGGVYDYFAENPQLLDQLMDQKIFDINATKVKPAIAGIAEQYLEKRSTITEYLSRKLMPSAHTDDPPGYDVLHVRDPRTGDLYSTNRAAAIQADNSISKHEMGRMLGTGALLAGGYKLVSAGVPAALRPVAAGTALLAAHRALRPDYGPQYMTEEGTPISAHTEMQQEKQGSSVALPLLGSAGLVTALGYDYENKLQKGIPVHDEREGLLRRGVDNLGAAAYHNPALSTLSALAAYGIMKHKLANWQEGTLCAPSDDPIMLPDVDFDLLSDKLGSLILSNL